MYKRLNDRGHPLIKSDCRLLKMSEVSCVKCPSGVINGKDLTADKRTEVFGFVAGGSKSMGPEKFQVAKIEEGTGIPVKKTQIRINTRTSTLENVMHPNKKENGFDYTENFDGCQTCNNGLIYINLKCVCGKGGSQTRTLREVYWFVESQLEVLKTVENIWFVNILDGDEAYNNMNKFNYLLSLKENENVKRRIYVGDLKGYFDWLNQ